MFSLEILEKCTSLLEGNDLEFFKRAWQEGTDKYENRIKAIQFQNLERVLDAGFGMGQWSFPLSKFNEMVYGIEYSGQRVKVVKKLIEESEISNVEIANGSVEDLPYEDDFFYGVIFLTDIRKTLHEFYRVLKPEGKLYFTANGLGWYIFCLIEQHNKSENYDPRQMAVDSLAESLSYFSSNEMTYNGQLVIRSSLMDNELEKIGFRNTIIKPEGEINLVNSIKIQSFYKHQSYLGQEFAYEVLTQK